MTSAEFIAKIANALIDEASRRNYQNVSCSIAQAIVESNYGKSQLSARHYNFFGLKRGSANVPYVSYDTKEWKNGAYATCSAEFRAYSSIEDGVKGYYDFLNYERYSNLKTAKNYREFADRLVADGYATSPIYADTLKKVVDAHSLTLYDYMLSFREEPNQSIDDMVRDTLAGRYGNGEKRKFLLGDMYAAVQKKINQLLKKG